MKRDYLFLALVNVVAPASITGLIVFGVCLILFGKCHIKTHSEFTLLLLPTAAWCVGVFIWMLKTRP